MPIERARLDRMIAKMDAWLTQREQEQAARHDAEDREKEEELARGNTMPTPTQPFSDSPPEKIHGEGREDQVESPWPPKPRVPIPIETL
jgi:hypothetical protein